ncbi:MAG: F0F1 ATP synthase subunit epsilon [Succinivibrionaceae bacterium]|nr:F0F1 ATP synthase subunit epsilon [Succinivibrionaceae bacterium]
MQEAISFKLDVISGVGQMYSGMVKAMSITGSEGELGIRRGHAPLLTTIKAGMVSLVTQEDKEEQFYLAGGVLEVQPSGVTVLADTAMRADDIDEAKAQAAIKAAKEAMSKHAYGDKDYSAAFVSLAQAMAQLKVVEVARKRHR